MPSFSYSEHFLLSLFCPEATFEFNGNTYEVIFSGKPSSPDGEPKTDIFARCKNTNTLEDFDLKISYKQENADFLENKINAERAAQILGPNWSSIIQQAIIPLQSTFLSKPLVFKDRYRRTEAGAITLGWKFDFLIGTRGGELSGVIPLSLSQKQDIYSGSNLSDSKKNATVNNTIIDNSGVAEYIIIENAENITTIQDAVNALIPIDRYVTDDIEICFACKALNCRTLHDPIKWDGDRPLGVFINWGIAAGKLTPHLIFNAPLSVKGNAIGNQLLAAMQQLGIRTTHDINDRNCVASIIYQE